MRVLSAKEIAETQKVSRVDGFVSDDYMADLFATLAAYQAVVVAAKGYLNKKHGRGPLDAALSALPEEPGEAAGPVTGGER